MGGWGQGAAPPPGGDSAPSTPNERTVAQNWEDSQFQSDWTILVADIGNTNGVETGERSFDIPCAMACRTMNATVFACQNKP